MNISPNLSLYVAVALYAAGTLLVFLSIVSRRMRVVQPFALASMILGFISHTIWIGTICSITKHPPLTNLPEASSFIAWTIFAVTLFLLVRYKVQTATFFVYPAVLVLMLIPLAVQEPFAALPESARSNLFTAHMLLSALGIAGLLIGLAFTVMFHIQSRALKSKARGRFYDIMPSLQVCDFVSYRALAAGFAVYTFGLITGVLWSYHTTAGLTSFRVKQVAAFIAWILFATLLQSYVTGSFRMRKNIVISVAALVSVSVAILGIQGY